MKRHPLIARLNLLMLCTAFLILGSCSHHAPQITSTPVNPSNVEVVANITPLRITVLFFNDLHGYLLPFTVKQDGQKTEVGGIARMASLIHSIESDNTTRKIPTFLFFAGDMLQGTPMSTEFKGKPDVECFNRLGVDAMTVGNHEFDFGIDTFLSLKTAAKFPIISSNIVTAADNRLLCEPSAAFNVTDTIQLTVIGVTTTQLMQTTKPSNVKDLKVIDPLESVRREYDAAAQKGPVIVLSHSEVVTDEAIANALPGLTAIISGHNHVLLDPRKLVGNVPVFQAFEKGRYLGKLDLTIHPTTRVANITSWTYLPIDQRVEADPDIEALLATYQAKLDETFKAVIGTNKEYLNGDRNMIRYEETNLGNFATDIMREHTGTDIALINSGSLRASIDVGPITVEELFQTMPYANEMLIVEVKGSVINDMLRRSVRASRDEEDGGFLHVSGVRFRIRDREPVGIEIGGKPLDLAATYRLAITDFMAEGGDGYDMLVGLDAVKTGLPLRELIVDTVWMKGTIDVRTDGRIIREPSEPLQ